MPQLKNWSKVGDRLQGEVYGDDRFVSGLVVVTSPVTAGPVLLGDTLVAKTRSGTIYELPVYCCIDVPTKDCEAFGPSCEGCPAKGKPFCFGEAA
jgi:hypothetical protein